MFVVQRLAILEFAMDETVVKKGTGKHEKRKQYNDDQDDEEQTGNAEDDERTETDNDEPPRKKTKSRKTSQVVMAQRAESKPTTIKTLKRYVYFSNLSFSFAPLVVFSVLFCV